MRTLTLLLGVVAVLAKLVGTNVNMALMLVLHCPVGTQQVFLCLSVGGCVMVMGEITLEQTNPRTSRRREGE
jgi:hypothetical protein